MVTNMLSDDLRLLYRCFARREANLTCIVEEMKKYIITEGDKVVNDADNVKDPVKYTEALIEFKDRIDKQISYCFNSDMKFERGRDDSFREFLNKCPNPPRYLANFLNNFMIKASVGLSNQEIEVKLTQVMRLFCCLNDRDIFTDACAHFYHLRLLNKTMQNQELEEQLIKKIEGESGFSACTKMKAMTKDITISKDMVSKYYAKNKKDSESIELESVQCLSQGSWPIKQSEAVKIDYPLSMKKVYDSFIHYYEANYHRKKLYMLNQYGSTEMKFLPMTKLILHTNIIQACILTSYN